MKIEQVSLKKISPYDKNAKKHPLKQIRQVADSIQEFGFNQPIIVDSEGVIVVGHGRYEAAKALNLATVPVLRVNLTEEQAKAYRLADNKLNESDWDMGLVVEELKGLSLEMLDLTGFDKDLVIENDNKDDELPEIPTKPKSKLGDVYELGSHRVLCGDSTDSESIADFMHGIYADMVFTDPPYNVDYQGSKDKKWDRIKNDNMDDVSFEAFLTDAFSVMCKSMKAGAAAYVFHDSTTQHIFEKSLQESGLNIASQLIWNKPYIGLGMNDYRKKHEPFFYCYVRNNRAEFYGNRSQASVVEIPEDDTRALQWLRKQKEIQAKGYSTIWNMKREPVGEYVHPTQKPVELITYAITNSSKAGDIVLDPFLGSGSTLIASEKSNRTCYGMELDPVYVDVIVQRYVDFTGTTTIVKNGKEIQWKHGKEERN